MTPVVLSNQIFNDIALCLSGGGYRAAAYHLGALDLLDELDLLPQVKLLSTVSGGSILGMSYAVWRIEGQPFGAFYEFFYKFLLRRNVVEDALAGLRDSTKTVATQNPSLIRAAAQVYANELFQDRRFKLLLDKAGAEFKELIFNATEFRIGASFRFRASRNPQAVIGNNYFRVDRGVAEQIRLADIVAASSCFPSAFEPIRFPDDFVWNDLAAVRNELKSGFKSSDGKAVTVPLMDGGIYDNQGLDSAKLAIPVEEAEFGILLICDTNQRDDEVFDFPVQPSKGWLPLRWIVRWLRLVLALSLVSAFALVMQFWRTLNAEGLSPGAYARVHPYELLFVYLIPFLLTIAVAGGLVWLRRVGRSLRRVEVAGAVFDVWKMARELTVPDLLEMLRARFGSLTALASSVFLKRIRNLVARSVFTNPERRDKVAFNVLYELLLSHQKLEEKDPELKPSAELRQVATRAERMATTLWFANEDELKNLIICGQATTCFNLLRFLQQRYGEQLRDSQNEAARLYLRLKEKWLALNQDAACLLRRPRA